MYDKKRTLLACVISYLFAPVFFFKFSFLNVEQDRTWRNTECMLANRKLEEKSTWRSIDHVRTLTKMTHGVLASVCQQVA